MIGSLGSIAFTVSANQVRTFDNFNKQAEARYHEHTVIFLKPKLEYLGESLKEVSFTVRLDASMGVNPLTEIARLERLRDSGTAVPLVVGGNFIAQFVITSISESWRNIDNRGRLRIADLTLNLKEYADG